MIRIAPVATFCLLISILSPSVLAEDPKPGRLSDFIVAKVNGEIITSADILKEIGPALEALGHLPKREQLSQQTKLWTGTIRKHVTDILALQAAKRYKIEVSDREVQQEYASFIRRLGGEAQARKYAAERGVTLRDIQSTLKKELTVKRLIMEKIGLAESQGKRRPTDDVFITPGEIRRYYRTHKVQFSQEEGVQIRQIFLSWKENRQEVEDLARSLVGQLRKGADFAQLARSTSPALGRHGGRFPVDESGGKLVWHYVPRGQLLAEIDKVAFRLPEGGVSDPIRLDKGIYVIKVEKKRLARVIPFSEAQVSIRNTLWRRRVQAKLERVKRDLREKATIWPPNLFEKPDFRYINKR